MRKIFLLQLLCGLISMGCSAQFYKSVLPSPEFTKALEKIVLEYRFNFEPLKGDSIAQVDGTRQYTSLVKLPGITDATITYYNSKLDTTASWQGVVYNGASYAEAVRAYENTFRLIKKSKINWVDRTTMRFSGELEPAKEEIGFATSVLYLDQEDVRYKNLVAEVDLLGASYGNWEVRLSIQRKKDDTEKY